MTKNWRLWAILLILAAIGGDFLLFRLELFGQGRQVVINGIAAPPLPTLDAVHVAEGEALYAQYCATCHGANLEGKPEWKTPLADGSFPPPPHDSSGHTWHHKDELLMSIIQNGGNPKNKPQMPAYKAQLTEREILAILAFIKSTWGNEERKFQWWMTAASDRQ
jgi:mono/diheme cytochrome c family protein